MHPTLRQMPDGDKLGFLQPQQFQRPITSATEGRGQRSSQFVGFLHCRSTLFARRSRRVVVFVVLRARRPVRLGRSAAPDGGVEPDRGRDAYDH